MRGVFLIGIMCLVIGVPPTMLSGAQSGVGDESIRDRFVGAWRLVSLEEEGADGKIHGADSIGQLVFTRDGHMSVQAMHRNSEAGSQAANHAEPVQYAQGGYEATFGTYEIDERAHSFTFHVEGALVRTLIGKDLRRSFEFSGTQLIVKSTRPDEHWRVVWERYWETADKNQGQR